MCTVFPAHEIMHICWWALGQADPARNIAGWGKNAFPVSSGTRAGGTTWVLYHWGGGSGAGAVAGRDGFNQMGPMITLGGLVIPNAETYEQLYPVRVHRQEFRCDAAGPGEWRGGTGVEYEAEIDSEAVYSFRGEGVGRATGKGVEHGGDGAGGTLAVHGRDGSVLSPPQYALLRLGASRLVMQSPGGGGFGDPRATCATAWSATRQQSRSMRCSLRRIARSIRLQRNTCAGRGARLADEQNAKLGARQYARLGHGKIPAGQRRITWASGVSAAREGSPGRSLSR
jgi:N-methylhydantoinase B